MVRGLVVRCLYVTFHRKLVQVEVAEVEEEQEVQFRVHHIEEFIVVVLQLILNPVEGLLPVGRLFVSSQ